MKLHVLFGQRKERYPGQYSPEALAVTDEWSSEDNPDWLTDTKVEREAGDEFEALAIITFEVSQEAIVKRLRPELAVMKAVMIDESN